MAANLFNRVFQVSKIVTPKLNKQIHQQFILQWWQPIMCSKLFRDISILQDYFKMFTPCGLINSAKKKKCPFFKTLSFKDNS